MIRRLIAGVVVAIGVFAVVIGVQRWLDARAAQSVVHALMHAVQVGDRTTVLSLLHPERRALVELSGTPNSPENIWQKQPGMTYEISDLTIQGDHGIVQVIAKKQGYTLQPLVHLRRGETGRWKIDRIENLEVDRRYLEDRQAYARFQGNQLAGRLKEALKNRPGVTIERVSFTDESADVPR